MKSNEVSTRFKVSGVSFALLSILFLICILVQVFFAGLAIFVNPANWTKHTGFIHLFEFIPVLMFIIAFVGKLPRWVIGHSAALFGVIFVMYFTANITPVLPWAAALHPVMAFVLFWMSVKSVPKVWEMTFKRKQREGVAAE
ncbi:DUF6220 domain-containing protein [Neobacillus sp. CF12]|uniref:DUF6220 domain-containing protein n=1 Tax=Neobacillus sp. CF12 TaxID=3055864 RepID=UPI0025A2C963|nr:DUF6220 domain-containing protein [Neobacillus sp. CF12]MDM5327205.1 DUF6220 domain-containing protein [Neobacillus sp. CF12]